jgi:hypothetical protein
MAEGQNEKDRDQALIEIAAESKKSKHADLLPARRHKGPKSGISHAPGEGAPPTLKLFL